MDYQITEETLWRVESVMRQLRLMRDMLSYADQDSMNFHIRPNDLLQFIEVNSDTLEGVIETVHERHRACVKETIRGVDLANLMLFCSGVDSGPVNMDFHAIEHKLTTAAKHSGEMMAALEAWKKVLRHKAGNAAEAFPKATTKAGRAGLVKHARSVAAAEKEGVPA